MNDTLVTNEFLSRIRTFFLTGDGQYRAERYHDGFVVTRHEEIREPETDSLSGVRVMALQVPHEFGEWDEWFEVNMLTSAWPYGPDPRVFVSPFAVPPEYRDW